MGYVDSRRIPGAFERHTLPRCLTRRMALRADHPMRVLVDDVLQARAIWFNPFSRRFVFIPMAHNEHFSMIILCNASMALPTNAEALEAARKAGVAREAGKASARGGQAAHGTAGGETSGAERRARRRGGDAVSSQAAGAPPRAAGGVREVADRLGEALGRATERWKSLRGEVGKEVKKLQTAGARWPERVAMETLQDRVGAIQEAATGELGGGGGGPATLLDELKKAADSLNPDYVGGDDWLALCRAWHALGADLQGNDSSGAARGKGAASAEAGASSGAGGNSPGVAADRNGGAPGEAGAVGDFDGRVVRACAEHALEEAARDLVDPAIRSGDGRVAEGAVQAASSLLRIASGSRSLEDEQAAARGDLRAYIRATAGPREPERVTDRALRGYAQGCETTGQIPRHPYECIRYGCAGEAGDAGVSSGASAVGAAPGSATTGGQEVSLARSSSPSSSS